MHAISIQNMNKDFEGPKELDTDDYVVFKNWYF